MIRIILFIVFLFESISSSAQEIHSVVHGQFSPAEYDTIKAAISRAAGTLRDTIIIKYEFNKDHCWAGLNDESEEAMTRRISSRQQRFAQMRATRPGVSFIHLRETGSKFSRYVFTDNAMFTDNNRAIKKLLFKKKMICGNSVIILPDRRYLVIEKDPHYAGFEMQSEQIETAMTAKQINIIYLNPRAVSVVKPD